MTRIKAADRKTLGRVDSHIGVPKINGIDKSITVDAEAMHIQPILPGKNTEHEIIYLHTRK